MPDDTTTDPDPTPDPDSDAQLGEAGKKALAAERAAKGDAEKARKAADRKVADLEAQLAKISDANKSEADKAIDAARKEAAAAARAEALGEANGRIVRAEIRVAAAGKLADPEDAIRFLDPDDFKVGDDGAIDPKAVAKAIDDLVKTKPYLAANGRPAGSPDGGPRGTGGGGADMNALIRQAAGR